MSFSGLFKKKIHKTSSAFDAKSAFGITPNYVDPDNKYVLFINIDPYDIPRKGVSEFEPIHEISSDYLNSEFNRILEVEHSKSEFIDPFMDDARKGLLDFTASEISLCMVPSTGKLYVVDGQHRLYAMNWFKQNFEGVRVISRVIVTLVQTQEEVYGRYMLHNGRDGRDIHSIMREYNREKVLKNVIEHLVKKYKSMVRINAKLVHRPRLCWMDVQKQLESLFDKLCPEISDDYVNNISKAIIRGLTVANKDGLMHKDYVYWSARSNSYEPNKFDKYLTMAIENHFVLGLDRRFVFMKEVKKRLERALA